MTDVMLIVDRPERDEALLSEVARRRADRVTVLMDSEATQENGEVSRVAHLRGAIENRTGAIVVGLAASREQLTGWRFDRVVGPASES